MLVRCPHCSVKLKLADHLAGRKMRCPRCSNVVRLVAIDEFASTESSEGMPATAQHASTLREQQEADLLRPKGEFAPLVIPVGEGGPGYDLDAFEVEAPAVNSGLEPSELPALARAGTVAPEKSKTAKARELLDLKHEGNRYLRQIRWLLLILGCLMVAYNVYTYMKIEANVAAFKQAMLSVPKVHVDPVQFEAFLKSFRRALWIETILYFVLGVVFCTLGLFIHKAPTVITWAALGSYVGMWILDLIIVEAVFGSTAVGLVLYSLDTIFKVGIIRGLWQGVRIGVAYDDQVRIPIRNLVRGQLEA